jgi:hypothetical protein
MQFYGRLACRAHIGNSTIYSCCGHTHALVRVAEACDYPSSGDGTSVTNGAGHHGQAMSRHLMCHMSLDMTSLLDMTAALHNAT